MAAIEAPPSQLVIELFHRAARPADQLAAATEMVDMTLRARLGLELQGVQAMGRRDLGAEVLVAGQAQTIDDSLARLMTLVAVAVAIDARVGICQRAR